MLFRHPNYQYSPLISPLPKLPILPFCYSDTQITSTPLLLLRHPNYQYSPFVIPTPKLPILPFCYSDTQITNIPLLFLPLCHPDYQYSLFAMLPLQSLILTLCQKQSPVAYSHFATYSPLQSPVAYSHFATYSPLQSPVAAFCQSAAQTTSYSLLCHAVTSMQYFLLTIPPWQKLEFPFKHTATTNTNTAFFCHCASFSRMQANGQR